jgi:AraC-like DNA-binding protein
MSYYDSVLADLEREAAYDELKRALEAAKSDVEIGHQSGYLRTSQAAEKCGFSSSAVFLRIARKVLGLLPSATLHEELGDDLVVTIHLWSPEATEAVRTCDAAEQSRARARKRAA